MSIPAHPLFPTYLRSSNADYHQCGKQPKLADMRTQQDERVPNGTTPLTKSSCPAQLVESGRIGVGKVGGKE